MIKLQAHGRPIALDSEVMGRITRFTSDLACRSEQVLLLEEPRPPEELQGYRGIVTPLGLSELGSVAAHPPAPLIHSLSSTEHLREGHVVLMNRHAGGVHTLYRPESPHNSLFATDRCNSNCLMCSQPPIDRLDDTRVGLNLELIELMSPTPEVLGITGGEPTLLGDGLLRILRRLKDKMPDTYVHMLSNGRRFADGHFALAFAEAAPPRFTVGVPLYSSDPAEHDYIVQCPHAFDQTVLGLHRLARYHVAVELRVVLHALTADRLLDLAEYIYWNLPFASHVALMGLEMMGYTPRNQALLWADPRSYQSSLREAVAYLALRGVPVSIYNMPLCLLDRGLWNYARRSISDYKNVFPAGCEHCSCRADCGGLFRSGVRAYGPLLRPLPPDQPDVSSDSEAKEDIHEFV